MESYILTRSMHLGFIKESFGKGAVIHYYPDKSKLVIDGRKFEDYRDIEILKRQAAKKPHAPYIIPYSDEARAALLGEETETAPVVPKRDGDKMPVIQSDADAHELINIEHTKVSKISNAAKEAERNRAKSDELPVIRGDESVEERLAELKEAKNTDLAARAARVRMLTENKAEMPIVRDDSLGSVGGSKSAALNAGMPVSGKRVEEAPASTMADARKAEVARNRERVAAEMGVDMEAAGIDEATPVPESVIREVAEDVAEVAVQETADAKDAEIAELRAQLQAQEQASAEPVVDPRDAEIAALKEQLAAKAPPKARKVPVIAQEG